MDTPLPVLRYYLKRLGLLKTWHFCTKCCRSSAASAIAVLLG